MPFPMLLQVRQKLEVPTTAVAQGQGYQWGPGTKPGTARWAGARRASTLDGAKWLEEHPDLAHPLGRQVIMHVLHAAPAEACFATCLLHCPACCLSAKLGSRHKSCAVWSHIPHIEY